MQKGSTMKPAQFEAQEPVAWQCLGSAHFRKQIPRDADVTSWNPLYALPPQRKPLSDEEIGAILEDINAFGTRLYTFARAIEAAHGIKE